ncbi:hypothetical protein M885DRAFT_612094, partial [Pelagophyceae sp. CCMP2097]
PGYGRDGLALNFSLHGARGARGRVVWAGVPTQRPPCRRSRRNVVRRRRRGLVAADRRREARAADRRRARGEHVGCAGAPVRRAAAERLRRRRRRGGGGSAPRQFDRVWV